MHRRQQRTSAGCRIAIVVLSLAVAVGTASAQHRDGQHDRDVYRNQRGPVVVARPVPYARVPYYYGRHLPYSYYPYYYHPYAYAWGPEPPWAFFAPSLGGTAISVSANNQQYRPANGGYTFVEAPVGTTVSSVPPSAEAVVVNGMRGYYYFGGTYYQQTPTGFVVVAPTPSMTVENLPKGGREVRIGAQTYVRVGNTYYEPIQLNGKDMWRVVEDPQ